MMENTGTENLHQQDLLSSGQWLFVVPTLVS